MQLLLLLVHLFSFISPAEASAGTLYDSLNTDQKNYWLKLLHYHNNKSKADGNLFFLASDGKFNPASEFESDIESFKKPSAKAGWFNYHPQCVFKERYEFIKKLGLLSALNDQPCIEFSEWKKGLNAKSITLIFSSSYPNNPSSLFGHTLIRLNQKEDAQAQSLLDYSVAFSAMPEKEDLGLVFAIKGMFGGYKGLLEVTKYYTKVNEYNNGESRDLIEYTIDTSPEEMDKLINHLWEIYQTTYFDYYFTDENCSAVLADILAVPFSHDDVNRHTRWYYLPSEMIKTFKKIPGRIKSESYRPSLKKQLEQRLSKLSASEVNELKHLLTLTSLPVDYDKTNVLDGVISYLDFTRYQTKDKLTSDQKILFRKALVRRSVLAQSADKTEEYFYVGNKPDLGHEPQKFSLFLRTEDAHSLMGIEFKEGYHDVMSNDQGYDSFSQFDFLTGTIIYDKFLNKLNFDQLTFVNLMSLHAFTFYDPQFSWSAKLTDERLYDFRCEFCHKLNARAYLGPTFKSSEKMALSFLGGIFSEVSPHFINGYRLGIGVEGSLLIQVTSKLKLGLFNEFRLDTTRKWREDYYNQLSVKQTYSSNVSSEWRVESLLVSRFKSLSTQTWINQLSYGLYF